MKRCKMTYSELQFTLRYFRDVLKLYVPNKLTSRQEILEEMLELCLIQLGETRPVSDHTEALFNTLKDRAIERGYTESEAKGIACWLIDNAQNAKAEKKWLRLMGGLGLKFKK